MVAPIFGLRAKSMAICLDLSRFPRSSRISSRMRFPISPRALISARARSSPSSMPSGFAANGHATPTRISLEGRLVIQALISLDCRNDTQLVTTYSSRSNMPTVSIIPFIRLLLPQNHGETVLAAAHNHHLRIRRLGQFLGRQNPLPLQLGWGKALVHHVVVDFLPAGLDAFSLRFFSGHRQPVFVLGV